MPRERHKNTVGMPKEYGGRASAKRHLNAVMFQVSTT